MELIQGIMVRTEVGRRRVASNRAIEHPAQPHAIHDTAMHAEAVFASPSLAGWRTPPSRVLTRDSQRDENAPDRMIVSAEASTDSKSSFQ